MGVEVAPEVFDLTGDGRSNEHVIITGSSDRRAAGLALSQASERLMMVTEDGRELSDEEAEALDDEIEATGEDGHLHAEFCLSVTFASRGPGAAWTARATLSP